MTKNKIKEEKDVKKVENEVNDIQEDSIKPESEKVENKNDINKELKVEEEQVDIVKEKELKSGELSFEAQLVVTIIVGLLICYAGFYTLFTVYIM